MHANRFGHVLNAGAQRADAAHHTFDLDTGATGFVELAHDALVHELVALHDDAAAALGPVNFRFFPDQTRDIGAQVIGRNENAAVVVDHSETGHHVKEILHIAADVVSCGKESQIGVDLCRRRVVVARTDMRIATHALGLTAHNQAELGMNLQPGKP